VEAAPEEAEAELPPWLAGIGEVEAAPEEAEAELPPWLAGIGEAEAAPEEAAAPPGWLEGEELPSGEEALAWLEQLMRGKEEELQEQARLEAEARLAEIMGRPAPPPEERVELPPTRPPEVPPAVEEPFGWVSFGEAEAVTPAEEVAPEAAPPGWLEGEELPSGEEALAWLEQLMRGKEEELQEQARLEAEARLAEIMGRPAPPPEERVELPPTRLPEVPPAVEEPFGWVSFGEAEAVTPAEEVAPEAAPPGWLEEAVTPVIEEKVFPVEAAVPEEIAAVLPPEIPPVELMVSKPPEEIVPQPPARVESIAERKSYLKKHPRDYQAWLKLAQTLQQSNQWEEALEAYSHLIRAGQLLEEVILDLEKRVKQRADVSTWRVLGDAYMKGGRLQEALEVYRKALEAL